MRNLIIVDNPQNWPLQIPEVEVISSRTYLTDPQFSKQRRVRVYNLCRSYRYQRVGYYVSLLAEARGHQPLPGVMAIQDLKSRTIVRITSDDLDDLIQKSFSSIQSSHFTLSIYFGKNVAKRYDRLSQQLFSQFQAPLLRAEFVRSKQGWVLQSVNPIAAGEIPDEHRPFVVEQARRFFDRPRRIDAKKENPRYDLAILRDPKEAFPPSDERAIQKFIKAAENLGFYVEEIGKQDYGRLAEFDALFIRETTNVNHYTYRFARRAEAEDLVVIDDPESILRCTNKVFLSELLTQLGISAPKTITISEETKDRVSKELGFPCILKQPDSSFSQGVVKADNREGLERAFVTLFSSSDLLVAQEFMPTEFDWRVGILNEEVLYVCKYFMARKHWQIYERNGKRTYSGKAECIPVEETPPPVIQTALKAANAIGRGFYGVDLKETNGKVYVIEVNDNPSIDSGFEDAVLKDELYDRIMKVILDRIEQQKERGIPSKKN